MGGGKEDEGLYLGGEKEGEGLESVGGILQRGSMLWCGVTLLRAPYVVDGQLCLMCSKNVCEARCA